VCRFEDPFGLVQVLFHAVLEQLGCELAEMGGWSGETGAADAAVEVSVVPLGSVRRGSDSGTESGHRGFRL
jgi:hypothetical protein